MNTTIMELLWFTYPTGAIMILYFEFTKDPHNFSGVNM